MKKLLLSFNLLLLVFCSVFAQKQYTYLKGQESPFNGEFAEPRYIGVDSITYVYYQNKAFVDPSYAAFLEGDGEFEEANGGYILIKCSPDGLTDTLKSFSETYLTGQYNRYDIKKYSDDGKLIRNSSVLELGYDTYIEEKGYVYDSEGRISKITTTKKSDRAVAVMVYEIGRAHV